MPQREQTFFTVHFIRLRGFQKPRPLLLSRCVLPRLAMPLLLSKAVSTSTNIGDEVRGGQCISSRMKVVMIGKRHAKCRIASGFEAELLSGQARLSLALAPFETRMAAVDVAFHARRQRPAKPPCRAWTLPANGETFWEVRSAQAVLSGPPSLACLCVSQLLTQSCRTCICQRLSYYGQEVRMRACVGTAYIIARAFWVSDFITLRLNWICLDWYR